MKLSVETYTHAKVYGIERGLRVLHDAGFDTVDFSYYWTTPEFTEKLFGDGYLEYARYLRGLLDELGMTCNQTHAPFEVAYGQNFDESNPAYVRLQRSIESSGILGARNVIVHRFTVPKDVSAADANRPFFKSLASTAVRAGVSISVENLFTSYDGKTTGYNSFCTPEDLRAFIESLDSPVFNACVDLGHVNVTSTADGRDLAPQDFVRGLDSSMLKALHVQDNDGTSDQHLLPTLSRMNWKEILKALSDIGYDGDLTFEIFGYFGRFSPETLPKATELAALVGKEMLD